jgi:flagellin-like protein
MVNFKQNEEAVSPVIGVILMVAITVILAAVIAAFVFGMADSIDTQPRNVAATAQISGDYLVVTYQGGPDHDEVLSVNCSAVVAGKTDATPIDNIGIAGDTLKVGYKWSARVLNNEEAGNNYPGDVIVVTVSAKFNDGTEKVILDKNLKVPDTSS